MVFASVRCLVVLVVFALALASGVHDRISADGGLVGLVRVNGRPQKDVVVWLDDATPAVPVRRPVVLDQRNLTFSPHVLAVRAGTSVSMPNSDKVFHNVFSFRDGKRFDLGLYPVGQSRVVTHPRFALHTRRDQAGLRVRVWQGLSATLGAVHQTGQLTERRRTAFDAGVSYSAWKTY